MNSGTMNSGVAHQPTPPGNWNTCAINHANGARPMKLAATPPTSCDQTVRTDVPVRAPLWRYPLLLESESERDRLFEMLWHAGLGPSRLYRMPLGDFSRLRDQVKGPSTPMATDLAGRLLALPLHSSMRMQDYDRIRAVLRRFANSRISLSKRRFVAESS